MKLKMILSLIIVNWNSGGYLKKCLDSIFQNKPHCSFEIIIIDNNSNDQSLRDIKKYYRRIILVRNTKNVGLSKANNQGIKLSKGKYILFLNPDTKILHNSLDKMIDYFDKQKNIGALGPKLINPDGSIQTSCHGFVTLSHAFFEMSSLHIFFPKNRINKFLLGKLLGAVFNNLFASYKAYTKPKKVNVIMGSCFLTSRKVLNVIGYFDEHFFLYHEENELCYRMKKHNFERIYFPYAKVIHYSKQSTSKLPETVFFERCKSLLYYFKKHYGKKKLLFKFTAIVALMINIPICLIFNKKKNDIIKTRLNILKYLLSN